jgi:hypothetical protein
LQPGDILITSGKFDTGSHIGINIGQALFSHSSKGTYDMVHAAVYIGNNTVAEAVGDGIRQNPVEQGHTYVVFRYKDQGLANAVAVTARTWSSPNAAGKRMTYCYRRLATAVFSLSALGPIGKAKIKNLAAQIDRPGGPLDWWGRSEKSMICSEFVLSCWNATSYARAQTYAIKADPTSCTPKELSNKLRKSDDWYEYNPLDVNVLPAGAGAH